MDKPTPRRFEGRAAFVAQLAAIRAEVESGISLTSIYEARKAKLGIGYRHFHRLVARHIGLARDRFSHPNDRERTSPDRPVPSTEPQKATPVTQSSSPGALPAAATNPTASNETPTENAHASERRRPALPRHFRPHE